MRSSSYDAFFKAVVACTEGAVPLSLQHKSNVEQTENEIPIILWWYQEPYPHDDSQEKHELHCSAGKCFSTNKRILRDDPKVSAFVFYGTSFLANDLPLPRNPGHMWALIHEESPKNNWIFSHKDGIEIFNYTATFGRESDYPLTTQFIVDANDWVTSKYFVSTEEKNRLRVNSKLAPVVYLQRDCNPPSDRDRYVKELMRFIDIDSYGPCLNNRKMPSDIDGFHKLDDEEYYQFLSRYKFHLAFENAICKDYMTEKLFRPLEVGAVPVYMGSSHASEFMPNDHSAIFVSDFESPKHLAMYLLELDKDDSMYNEYLRHREKGIENERLRKYLNTRKWRIHSPADKVNFIHRMFAGLECDLCNIIVKRKKVQTEYKDGKSKRQAPIFSGKQSQMGCPEPIESIKSHRVVNKSVCYWEGFHEAKALKAMLLANESDSGNYVKKYLKRRTDKYP
eukprot:gene16452-7866_t